MQQFQKKRAWADGNTGGSNIHSFTFRRMPEMLNSFELGAVMSLPAKSPLTSKSLVQIKYERGHYQSQFWSNNVKGKGRYVLCFQLKKLDKLIRAFELQNNNDA